MVLERVNLMAGWALSERRYLEPCMEVVCCTLFYLTFLSYIGAKVLPSHIMQLFHTLRHYFENNGWFQDLPLPTPPAPPRQPQEGDEALPAPTPQPQESPPPVDRAVSSSDYTSRYLTEFEEVQMLGRGGFGAVCKARNKLDEKEYAIKRIKLPTNESPRKKLREALAVVNLNHPNIVRYYSSWLETPPLGWQNNQDTLLENSSEESYSEVPGVSGMSEDGEEEADSVQFPSGGGECRKSIGQNRAKEQGSSLDIVFEDSQSSVGLGKEYKPELKAEITISESGDLTHGQESLKKLSNSSQSQSLVFANRMEAVKPPSILCTFLYIQMELCLKESLSDWLRNNLEREKWVVVDMFSDITNAVEYIHKKNLMHRDLKPSNIFFSLEGKVKVGDFGLVTTIAEEEEEEEQQAAYTPATHMERFSAKRTHSRGIGTCLYMSPEQFRKRYDHKVDIYSLGLIFFEMLVPFGTDMQRHSDMTQLKEKMKFPYKFEEEFPDETSLLKLMLSEDPACRPTTEEIRARQPLCSLQCRGLQDTSPEDHLHLSRQLSQYSGVTPSTFNCFRSAPR